jgi:hypothetical protein
MSIEMQSKSVRRVVVLEQDPAGGYAPVTVYQRKLRKKKGSRFLRPLEKAVRKMADAASLSADSYLTRHQSSNGKKRDGWIRDLRKNVFRAAKTGGKRIKVVKLITT